MNGGFFGGADSCVVEVGQNTIGLAGADDGEFEARDSVDEGSMEGLPGIAVTDEADAEGVGRIGHELPE